MTYENVRLAVRGRTAVLIIHEQSPRAAYIRALFGGLEVPVLLHSARLEGRELRLRLDERYVPLQGLRILYETRGRGAGMDWGEFRRRTDQDGIWMSIRIPEGGGL